MRYPTRYGIVRHRSTCKDNWSNIKADKNGVKLQAAALRSFHHVEAKLGRRLVLTGSWRSCALQTSLYNSDSKRYAHPNSTLHTHGLAIDVHTGHLNEEIRKRLLNNGWHQSRPVDEPWHFSFRLTA